MSRHERQPEPAGHVRRSGRTPPVLPAPALGNQALARMAAGEAPTEVVMLAHS